ncbi:hypothetical protein P7C70_g7709, partial [Phenoliferia sp. Uapishka_3]
MSSSSGISGLGISFLPDPSPPRPRSNSRRKTQAPISDSYAPQHQHPAMRHSVSYDVGLNRSGWDLQLQPDHLEAEMMYHQQSNDSNGSRRVRIASGEPEVFGGGSGKNGGGRTHHQPILSPLSDFDSGSSSDSQAAFSPASMESLPSSTDEAPELDYAYSQSGRLARSMGGQSRSSNPPLSATPMQAAQSRTYPHPIDDDDVPPAARQSYHRPHPNFAQQPDLTRETSPLHLPAKPTTRPSSSRLTAFIRERTLSRDLARPKSMMELGQLYTQQGSEASFTTNGSAEMQRAVSDSNADDESHGGDPYGAHSPNESVPSSAGGLQRRHFERRLIQQQQLEREKARREFEEVAERAPHPLKTVRSVASLAETGGAFIQLDQLGSRASGRDLEGAELARDEEEEDQDDNRPMFPINPLSASLSRQSTLLTAGANPVRRSKELDRLLSPTKKLTGSVSMSAINEGTSPALSSTHSATTRTSAAPSRASSTAVANAPVVLEQAKSTNKTRVELDLVLESALVVEGGALKGRIEIRVRKPKDKENEVWLGMPKVRVVGFEELAAHDARHIFYHHASNIPTNVDDTSSSAPLPWINSAPDAEGFQRAVVGQHVAPFSLQLPIGKGAKGGWKGKQGVVRYIVIASMKLKSARGGDRSIAHFYRHVEIFPYFNPATILAPAMKPLETRGSKALFMGGTGKVNLVAKMHRSAWVAGQRCYVDVRVENESSKKVKTLTLTLIRTTTVFRPRPWLNTGEAGRDPQYPNDPDVDADACQTQTTRKKVAETTLEMGKKVKGVTAKGSWMGVEGGQNADFSHSLQIPPDALTIPRGRYIEITYSIKVSVSGSLSADVSADIPLRIVNFVSLDPPPGHVGLSTSPLIAPESHTLAKSWSVSQLRPAPAPVPLAISEVGSDLAYARGEDTGPRLQLDDFEDEEDFYHYADPEYVCADLADESEDELDALLDHSPLMDDSDDESFTTPRYMRPTTPSSRAPSSIVESRSSSPVKPSEHKSSLRKAESFIFATPASPLRVVDPVLAPPPSPTRRQQPPTPSQLRTTTARGPLPPPPAPFTRPMSKNSPPTSHDAIGSTASSRARAATLSNQPSLSSLRRAGVVTKRPSQRSLRAEPSPNLSDRSEAPGLDPSSAKSSPDMEARTPPMQPTIRASPRKVLTSPSLRESRSMGDLRGAKVTRQTTVLLPSVRSKIEALETRQTTLSRFATNGAASRLSHPAVSQPMQRGNSATESEASFTVGDLGRANSMASFQAPLFRKVHRNV